MGSRQVLPCPFTVPVDPVNGTDMQCWDQKTPWQTLQGAYSWVQSNLDLAGFTVTLLCGKGVYKAGLHMQGALTGQRSPYSLQIVGCGTPPKFEDCAILPSTPQNCISVSYGASATIAGFLLNGSYNGNQDLLAIGQYSMIVIGISPNNTSSSLSSMCFGPAPNPANHITVAFGRAGLQVMNNYAIWCAGTVPQCHIDADDAWVYYNTNGTPGLLKVELLDSTNFYDSFIHCSNSDLNIQAVNWACDQGPLQGTVTCKIEKAGVIDTGSGGNPNYFPGTIAPIILRPGWGLYL